MLLTEVKTEQICWPDVVHHENFTLAQVCICACAMGYSEVQTAVPLPSRNLVDGYYENDTCTVT